MNDLNKALAQLHATLDAEYEAKMAAMRARMGMPEPPKPEKPKRTRKKSDRS